MMAGEDARITKARGEVVVARTKLTLTLTELQHRIDPRVKVRAALDDVREQGSELADRANIIVRERPTLTVAAAATIALILARRPIARLFDRIKNKN